MAIDSYMVFTKYDGTAIAAESQVDFPKTRTTRSAAPFKQRDRQGPLRSRELQLRHRADAEHQQPELGRRRRQDHVQSRSASSRKIDIASPTFFHDGLQRDGVQARCRSASQERRHRCIGRVLPALRLQAGRREDARSWEHDDESPKENVTFEYGGLQMLLRRCRSPTAASQGEPVPAGTRSRTSSTSARTRSPEPKRATEHSSDGHVTARALLQSPATRVAALEASEAGSPQGAPRGDLADLPVPDVLHIRRVGPGADPAHRRGRARPARAADGRNLPHPHPMRDGARRRVRRRPHADRVRPAAALGSRCSSRRTAPSRRRKFDVAAALRDEAFEAGRRRAGHRRRPAVRLDRRRRPAPRPGARGHPRRHLLLDSHPAHRRTRHRASRSTCATRSGCRSNFTWTNGGKTDRLHPDPLPRQRHRRPACSRSAAAPNGSSPPAR